MFKQKLLSHICIYFAIFTCSQDSLYSIVFDSEYALNLSECSGDLFDRSSKTYAEKSVRFFPGSFTLDKHWVSEKYIGLDNGLLVNWYENWETREQALYNAKEKFLGKFNIVLDSGLIYMVDQNGYLWEIDLIRLDTRKKFNNLLTIKNIHRKCLPFFYSLTFKYRYTIELSDGSILQTKALDLSLEDSWRKQARVIRIGNNKNLSLINVDSILKRAEPQNELQEVFDSDFIESLELMNNSEAS